jgi:hypothetical protein
MNRRRQRITATFFGIALGLVVSVLVAAYLPFDRGEPNRSNGLTLSDSDGALHELVLHYTPDAAEIVETAYKQFLSKLPRQTIVHVVCPDQLAFDDLTGRLGTTPVTLRPVIVDHPITCWSRDRWLSLKTEDDHTIILTPRGEMAEEVWPERDGDGRVGHDLGLKFKHTHHHRSSLYFDGGDFVCDSKTAFVTPDVLRRNLQQTVQTRKELIERLTARLGRRIILLDKAPDHHAGMFMMTLGNNRVLVGDPVAGRRIVAEAGVAPQTLCGKQGADFSPETIALFDAVAKQCAGAGYAVHRIPVVPGKDGRTYLSYLNAILDERDGKRTVYLPIFNAIPSLDQAAAQTWRVLGFDVKTVNCADTYQHFGSLRCLVSVLHRKN